MRGWRRLVKGVFFVGFGCVSAFGTLIDEELIGFEVSVHASALGMANATVSRARGLDALFTNPAGLGTLSRSELSLTTAYDGDRRKSQLGRNEPSKASVTAFRVGSLGLVYDAETPRGFGVGIAYRQVRPLDAKSLVAGVETRGDYAGSPIAEERETRGNVGALTLGLGVEMARGIRFGIAADLWDGERNRTVLFEGDSLVLDDDYTRSISASRVKVGVELGVVPEFTLGGTFLFPSDVEIREDWIQRTLYPNAETDAQNGITDYVLHLPAEIAGGATLRFSPFRFSGELRYADWRKAFYSPAPARDVDRGQFERFYTSTVEARLGGELALGEQTALRAGFARTSFPTTWYDVAFQPLTLSLGLSSSVGGGVLLDFAYLFTTWERQDADVNETLSRHRFVAGARYVF